MLCFRLDSDYNGMYMCVNETSDIEDERWKKILSINFTDTGSHQAGDIYYNKEEKNSMFMMIQLEIMVVGY